jgi:putative Mg2+ transporter-C (MgtC) family protein
MLGWLDIILRLGAASLIGAMIGLNRELHHKSTGIRTLGLVALGSAIAVLAVAKDPAADASRVIQGVITGIGFLGAGVILHGPTGIQVQGLTTAAAIWMTASLGVLCGLGAWQILLVAVVLMGVLLVVSGPIEKRLVGPTGPDKGE